MNDKLNKFLVVVFLTILIWTWAFMSKEKEESLPGVLKVSPGSNPSLLVTFSLNDNSLPQTEIPLTSLNFKGAPSKLSDLQKRFTLPLDDPKVERLDFFYDPAEYKKTAGSYTLRILDYLQGNPKIQELALSLESCTPSEVTVNIESLTEKELQVECVNKNGAQIPGAVPNPAFVKIYVRNGYEGPATVELSPQLIDAARKRPIPATPFVKLNAAGMKREAAEPVQITLKTESQLKPNSFITNKPIGIIMSQELRERFKVTIVNETKARETTTIYATAEAFKAYENMTYPLQIEIRDSDTANLSQVPSKTVIYNFPPEYVKKGEIEEPEQLPRKVDIKIEPINPPPAP